MKHFAIIVIVVLLSATDTGAGDFTPNDFAYGIPLRIGGTDALYEFSLPDDVYQGITRSDLGDMCVFNGRGEVVPFTLSRNIVSAPPSGKSEEIALFPIPEYRNSKSEAMSLVVKRSLQGAIVSVETSETKAHQSGSTAYLLDASSLRAPLEGFSLKWEEQPEGTVARVRVEGSDNLDEWRILVPSALLLDLRYDSHRLERRFIETNGSEMKYYRISSLSSVGPPKLVSATARPASPRKEPTRRRIRIEASTHKGREGDYLFTMPGLMPTDRIRILLPEENTLVRAVFFSRAGITDPWKRGPSALLYRLHVKGEKISSPEIVLPSSTDRFLLMRVDRSGGGLGRGLPMLEAGWIPARITFLSRGDGPFQLAYGSGRAATCSGNGNALFRGLTDGKGKSLMAGTASPGAPTTLGGKTALRGPIIPGDRKTALLWSLLVMGVGILAWMAFRLHRQLNNTKGDNT